MANGETTTGSESERPVVNVVGERVALGPLRRDMIPAYVRWMNDFTATRGIAMQSRPMTAEAEEAWYADAAAVKPDAVVFTIYEVDGWRPVGNGDLREIDHLSRTATLGILIGEPDARGRGLGTEAVRLLLDYGFRALGLANIWLAVYEYNLAGRRAYEKAGMTLVGRRRESRWHLGQWWDECYYEALAEDFPESAVRSLLDTGAARDR